MTLDNIGLIAVVSGSCTDTVIRYYLYHHPSTNLLYDYDAVGVAIIIGTYSFG